MKIDTTKWLSRKEEISTASYDELVRSIITADGRGKDFKKVVLDEILCRMSIDCKGFWKKPTET